MQRSGAATRRFYAAFYHWTLRSSNPTRQCAGTTATLVARRKQSTTHGVGGSSLLQNHGESIGTSEQLRKEAVQSNADRPTESLDLWEHAVRDKSEKSVTVELLVPGGALRSKDVANRARIHEVKLSTPGLREDAGDDEPCAVVLEGDYTDVKAVWKNLYSHGAGQSSNESTATKQTTHADVEPIAHRLRQDFARQQQHSFVEKECSLPESFWQPIGKEGTVEYLQTQFGLHVDMLDQMGPLQYARLKGSERQVREVDEFLEDIRVWELEKASRKNSVDNEAEKQVKVIRRNDLPSDSLEVWQSVTRKQLQGETEIDICLPERVWQRIRRDGGAENLHTRFAMEFEPLKVSRDGKTRCIAFKGDVTYAERAKSYLESFRVNIPELREDEEYLKIYSAATGLNTTSDENQRQSARRSQEKIESNKRTAQPPSGKPLKRSATVSPEIKTTRDDTVSDKLREPRPAVEAEVDRKASRKAYKRLALTSPEEQSTHDNKALNDVHYMGRHAFPEHIRQELEASTGNTLAQIQQESGVEAILCLETAESKQYLKIVGSKDAREQARALLQKSIDSDNERTGRSNPDVDELARSIELDFSLPTPTHIAWVQMPEGTRFLRARKFHIQYQTYTSVRLRESASGKRLVRIRGPSASVNLVIARIQRLIDEERNATGKPSAKLEVLKMGLIEGVGEECPVELSEKSVEDEQQTSPEPTVKDTATEEQPPTLSDKKLDTPKAANLRTHFAWLKVPKTHSRSRYDARAKVIAEKHDCSINAHKHMTEKEGIVSIHGSEEALNNAIRGLQRLSDEGCKDNGILPVKLEVVSKGLYGDMPTTAAVRQSVLSSVKELDTPEIAVWLRIAKAVDLSRSIPMKTAIAAKNGCLVGRYKSVIEKEEGVLKIFGSREVVGKTINDLQQLCDEARKQEGKPPLKAEIVYMGSRDKMPEFTAVKQSILAGGYAIVKDQASESTEQHALPISEAPQVMPELAAVNQSIRTGAAAIGKDQGSESTEQSALPTSKSSQVEHSHFAWIKIDHGEAAGRRVRRILHQTVAEAGLTMTRPRLVGKEADEIQELVRLLGSEAMLNSTIEAVQQQLADAIRDTSGKLAGTVEIIQMGLKKDMVDYYTSVESIIGRAPAMSAKKPASLPQHISIGYGAAEQAEKSSLASTSGETPRSANQTAPLPQETSIENGAAEQAKMVSSSSASGETSQHATVDKTSAPEASKMGEQATKQSNQQLSDDMRSALRYITQPVALVTSYTPQGHRRQGARKRAEARGVTVSSFCTVTLQPAPVVSFNLRVPSRSWDAISGSGYLRAHLLKATPEGAAVAHAFTLPYEQPHQPFDQLFQSGMEVTYFQKTRDPAKVPRITSRAAVHANFVAKVMPEKCIQVGDHMIVVAEVIETELFSFADASSTGALSYGMRGYRQLGGEIKPMEIKPAEQTRSEAQPVKEDESVGNAPDKVAKITELDSVADHSKPVEKAPKKVESTVSAVNEITEPAEQESAVEHVQPGENTPEDIATNDTADMFERFAADPDEEDFEATPAPSPKNIEDLGPSSPMLDEESLRQVLEANEAAYSSLGLPSQAAAGNPALAEALNAVAGAYNDASEPAVSSQPESTSETQAPLEGQPADPAAPSQPESTPQTEAPSVVRPTDSATREERPANALSTGKRPWGMDDTMTQQIRKLSIYHNSPRRHYSTNNSDPNSPNSTSSPDHPPLSKQLLKTTAADYLAQIPTHRKRYTNLIKLHRSASSLEAQLQAPQATLTEAEALALTTQAQTTRRKVSRELALRNAQDLRAMLDNGRVASASAAQWLESNLENGQVVLLEEAKVLRRELEDGKLRVADFEKAKAGLTRDYEVIDAQLMRLRDFAEDDVEDMDDGEFGEGVVEENQEGREKGSG